MKIAYFTDTYLPNVDGVVTCLLNYRKELEKRGHEVYIFTPGSKKDKAENKDKNVHYFTSATFKPYPDYRISLFPFPSAVKRAKEIGPDIVHSHGIATTGLAAINCAHALKVPAIASFHTMVPEATHYLTKNEGMQKILEDVAWKYLKWYYGFFDTVLVTYNFKSAPEVKPAVARVAQGNIGVIAMKTQAGGYKTSELGEASPHQASLKFVLQDANVTAAIPAMVDLQQVKEQRTLI